jgi:hypothetical protein
MTRLLITPWTPPCAGHFPADRRSLPTAPLDDARRLHWEASPAGSRTAGAPESPATTTDTATVRRHARSSPPGSPSSPAFNPHSAAPEPRFRPTDL